MSGLYVLTVARDSRDPNDTASRPIVWEQYLDNGAADIESVRAFAAKIGDIYGETKIARLVFEGEEGFQS